jgi:hypothetical protein
MERQLRLNRGQPKQLHLGIQQETFPQLSRQGFGSHCVAYPRKRKCGFGCCALARRSKLESLGCSDS